MIMLRIKNYQKTNEMNFILTLDIHCIKRTKQQKQKNIYHKLKRQKFMALKQNTILDLLHMVKTTMMKLPDILIK